MDDMNTLLSQDIEGIVTFLTSADGGRTTPALSGYRPQFHYDGYDWGARQTYPDVEKVEPGMTVRVLGVRAHGTRQTIRALCDDGSASKN
jgi:translation elongation factor EF-Tu-like GTPase